MDISAPMDFSEPERHPHFLSSCRDGWYGAFRSSDPENSIQGQTS
jgi:hypothetical protein